MSYTRYYYKLIFIMILVPTCFGQSNCLPLNGTDVYHPNGLFLQFAPQKQYPGPRQNTSSTYITQQLANGTQILWDATQGAHGVGPQPLVAALKAEFAACVPKPALPPVLPPQTVPFFNTPLAIGAHATVSGDFNGDNIADLAVAVPGTNQVSVYLGNSDGTFQAPVNTTLGNASTRLTSIGLGDFNRDKKADIAVVDTVNNVIYVIFGRGDGNFLGNLAPLTIPVGHSPLSLIVADINNDGNSDIVVTNSADNTVSVMRGNGDGTFIPASVFPVRKNPVSVIATDLNGDGNLDLIVADNGSNDLAVLLGLGNGAFQNAVFTNTVAPPTYLSSADFTDDGIPDVVALAGDVNAVMMFTGGYQGKLTFSGAFQVPNLAASFTVNDFDSDGFLDLLVPDTDSGSPVLLLGRGDGTLNAPSVYAGSNGFTSLATGDFNNDGKADLVVTGANSTTSSLSILSGMGTGRFRAPVNIPVSGRTDVVAVGDFNKDGRLDLAVSGSQLNILINQVNGSFQQGAQYAINLIPTAVADFNKDGRLDIAGPFNGGLGVMLGNGDGTFRSAVATPAGSNPKTAVAADFNVDGTPDIAVLNAGTLGNPADPGGISVLLGNGTGSFSTATNVAAGVNPRALSVGDVNGDGKPDLVVATGGSGSGFQISVLVGKGDGTFSTPFAVPVPVGETPSAIALLDLDGDGNLDIVLSDCCADASTVYYRGNGDGTFQPALSFYGGNNTGAIVVGDWNGDGKPDLAMAYSPVSAPSLSGIVALNNHLGTVQNLVNTSGASFVPGPIAPDSIVAAFGTNLTTGTAAASGDASSLPTALASTSVTVKDSQGVVRTAQLFYVSPTQINYLVPAATALGIATVSVTAPNGVNAAKVNVIGTAPGLFTINSTGLAAGSGVTVVGANQSAFNLYYTDPITAAVTPIPISLGNRLTQVYLTLYGTGFRNRSSLDLVSVTVGGIYTAPLYAGAQSSYPGLDQLNFQIPPALTGAGKVAIQLTVNGVPSNPVNVTIQ